MRAILVKTIAASFKFKRFLSTIHALSEKKTPFYKIKTLPPTKKYKGAKTIGETHNNGATWQDAATDVEKKIREFDSMQDTATKAHVTSKRAALTGAPNKEADSSDKVLAARAHHAIQHSKDG